MERKARSSIALDRMNIIGTKTRATVKGNRPLLDAAIKVIYELKEFWPLSDRQVHYRLLNDPPLKHAGKPDSVYQNDRQSYQTLCNVLTRGRLSREIPWEAIGDETRPIAVWDVQKSVAPFIKKQFDRFMKGYARDYMQSQPNHIEIVGEKLTIKPIIDPVAMEFCIPYTIGRGYSSITPRHDMAERFWKSGKERLIVLILSDFDPDGEEIAQSFARSMRDDFDIDVHPIKVALTGDQVGELRLPPKMEAKEGSKNFQKFIDQYGKNVFELEAIEPEKLQEMLDSAIKSIIDVNAFNSELDQ
jgi:5S rRNA maturation endonuclease (ribonuclease M5)